MTDNVYAAPQANMSSAGDQSGDTRFFVVSTTKLAVMYLGSFGIYLLYWYYKQWELYKESQPFDSPAGKIWPAMRAIFSVLFTHALFSKVKAAQPDHPAVASWSPMRDATLVVLMLFVPMILSWTMPRPHSPLTLQLIGMALMFPIATVLCRVQKRINAVCGDETGAANRHITGANIAWLVLGALFWLSYGLAGIGLLLGLNESGAGGF